MDVDASGKVAITYAEPHQALAAGKWSQHELYEGTLMRELSTFVRPCLGRSGLRARLRAHLLESLGLEPACSTDLQDVFDVHDAEPSLSTLVLEWSADGVLQDAHISHA